MVQRQSAGKSGILSTMASWKELESAEPDFAELVRTLLDAHRHKTVATLRKDGSPRISGIETMFIFDDLWFGSMLGAVKARDLQRDPRFALHSASVAEPEWLGDAKLSGLAEEITDPEVLKATAEAIGSAPPGPMHLFRADITEASTVRLGDPADHLVIEAWREGRGLKSFRR